MSDTKYSVPDDHWETDDDEQQEEATSPVSIKWHEVDVVLTTDPEETGGYGRDRYTVHIGHDFDDSPVAVYATKHRWKGNYWRETKDIDWADVPGEVKLQVAQVVSCDGVRDLDPGDRVIGEDGSSRWKPKDDRNAPSTGIEDDDVRARLMDECSKELLEVLEEYHGYGLSKPALDWLTRMGVRYA